MGFGDNQFGDVPFGGMPVWETHAGLTLPVSSLSALASSAKIIYATPIPFVFTAATLSGGASKGVTGSGALTLTVAQLVSSLSFLKTHTTNAALITPAILLTSLSSRTFRHVAVGSLLTPTVGITGASAVLRLVIGSGALLAPRISVTSSTSVAVLHHANGAFTLTLPEIVTTTTKERVAVAELLIPVLNLTTRTASGRVIPHIYVPATTLSATVSIIRKASGQLQGVPVGMQTTVYLPVKTATGAFTTIPLTITAEASRIIVANAALQSSMALLSIVLSRTVKASGALQSISTRLFTQVTPLPVASKQWYRVTSIQHVPGTRLKRVTLEAVKRPTARS